MSSVKLFDGTRTVTFDVPDDEVTVKRLRKRIENSMKQLRATGAKVTIDADFGVAVLVLVEPQVAYPVSDDDWGKVTDSTRMWIDPDMLIAPHIREMQEAEKSKGGRPSENRSPNTTGFETLADIGIRYRGTGWRQRS